jgi:hypothetical protein
VVALVITSVVCAWRPQPAAAGAQRMKRLPIQPPSYQGTEITGAATDFLSKRNRELF